MKTNYITPINAILHNRVTSTVIHYFLYVCLPEQLIAGSGANQDKDEVADGTQLEGAESQEVRTDLNTKEDGYSVGVPGPLTRIFVIANRSVANLVQDLILVSALITMCIAHKSGGQNHREYNCGQVDAHPSRPTPLTVYRGLRLDRREKR